MKELIEKLSAIDNKELDIIIHQIVFIREDNIITLGDTMELNFLKVDDNNVHLSTGLMEGASKY